MLCTTMNAKIQSDILIIKIETTISIQNMNINGSDYIVLNKTVAVIIPLFKILFNFS